MRRFSCCPRTAGMCLLLAAASAAASNAQTFTTLLNFNNNNGSTPGIVESLVQGPDGDFYGTTG